MNKATSFPDKLTEIQEALSKLAGLSTDIAQWRVDVGRDWSGDRAVWVYAKLKSESVDFSAMQTLRQRIQNLIRELEKDPDLLVYVHFRGVSESLDP
jgi:hypothetical protein